MAEKSEFFPVSSISKSVRASLRNVKSILRILKHSLVNTGWTRMSSVRSKVTKGFAIKSIESAGWE